MVQFSFVKFHRSSFISLFDSMDAQLDMDIDVKCKTMKLLEKKILRNKSMGYEAMHNVLRYEHFFFKQEYNFIFKKTIHKKKT